MPRKIHLSNREQLDATVAMVGLRPPASPSLGLPDGDVRFVRFLATTEDGLDAALFARLGPEYGQALVDADPETDLEQVGRALGPMDQVYLSAEGHVLHASPVVVEVTTAPDGTERERAAPVEREPNVTDDLPVRWTGKRVPKAAAIRRFVFERAVQIRHVDGLTYKYLHDMATELHRDGVMMLVRGGEKGSDPLTFQRNGTPYQGFLEGRVDGPRYQLILRLSKMELRRPAPAEPEAA